MLEELEPFFEEIHIECPDELKNKLYKHFEHDLIDNSITVKGNKLRLKLNQSKVFGFIGYPESFVHCVTRESKMKGERVFDCDRAKKIHWIKPVLTIENRRLIKYFQYEESDKSINDYFWFESKQYMVILKKITSEYWLITGFSIEKYCVQKYSKRYNDFCKKKIPQLR